MGYVIYKKKMDALIPSIIALGVLYLFVWIGKDNPIDLKNCWANSQKCIFSPGGMYFLVGRCVC